MCWPEAFLTTILHCPGELIARQSRAREHNPPCATPVLGGSQPKQKGRKARRRESAARLTAGALPAPALSTTHTAPASSRMQAQLAQCAKTCSAARRTLCWRQLTWAPVQGSKGRERLHSEAKVIRGDRHLKVTRRPAERLGLCISEIKGDPLLPATGWPDSPGALK